MAEIIAFNISLVERHYAKWPGPTSTLVVTIENIFAEIKVTLRK